MLIDTATLSPRAQARLAAADPAIVAFAATMPGGIRRWAEAYERDGYGRIVRDDLPHVPAPYEDDLVSIDMPL